MKNILFVGLLLIICCAVTSAKLPVIEIINVQPTPTVKEDVKQLTRESQQLVQFMKQLFDLHESDGLAVKLQNDIIDSLSIDFGKTPISNPNKAVLRLRFRQAAQIVKDKMDELLAIVPQ